MQWNMSNRWTTALNPLVLILLLMLAAGMAPANANDPIPANNPIPANDPTPDTDSAPADMVLVLDASGSMWGQLDGQNKIVIARQVLGDLIDQLPTTQRVGLLAYGHRQEGDCDDIELVAPVGPLDRQALKDTVGDLNPKGKTPITAAIVQAFEAIADHDARATVIVVTDGLETCGGDPCAAVRAAREAGRDFVMHIVGFDVSDEDVSQLECAAQAGGGRYLEARDADQLATALDAATEMTVEVPAGQLSVEAHADGKLQDVSIRVSDVDGKVVGVGRTYSNDGTNPRTLPLPNGAYTATVKAIGIKGDRKHDFEFEIVEGSSVEKTFDFSTGELHIGVTRNGEPSDAVYRVVVASSGELAAQGRTYTSAKKNPAVVRLTVGHYRAEVKSVEISGRPVQSFGEVEVKATDPTSLAHDYASGTLRVGFERDGELADAVLRIYADKQVAQGRTYTSAKSNPKTFTLSPGTYRVVAKAIGGSSSERTIEVVAGETATLTFEVESSP